jgi:hypothetical protein
MPPKQKDLSQSDLQAALERLALIQGHISQMPPMCISGVTIKDGFLVMAIKIPDHVLSIEEVSGEWKMDDIDIVTYATNLEKP